MAFAISLNADDIAFAKRLNELRRVHTTHPQPAAVRDGDLVGCTSEVALCKAWGLSYDVLGYDHGGTGDGGIDVVLPDGTTIDLKSSADHPDSWLVKRLAADWFIFSFVEMPYQVHFLGKQHRNVLQDLPLFRPVRGTRRVTIADILPIARGEFLG